MRSFRQLERDRTVAAVQQKRAKGPLNVLGAIGTPRLQGPTGISDTEMAVARVQFQMPGYPGQLLAANAGSNGDIAVQIRRRQVSISTSGIERNIGRRFNINLYRRGVQVDVDSHVRLFLEREGHGVAALALLKGVSRKARVLGGDMDMNRLTTAAGVDIQMAVTGAQDQRWLSTDRVALVPRCVALCRRRGRRQEE